MLNILELVNPLQLTGVMMSRLNVLRATKSLCTHFFKLYIILHAGPKTLDFQLVRAKIKRVLRVRENVCRYIDDHGVHPWPLSSKCPWMRSEICFKRVFFSHTREVSGRWWCSGTLVDADEPEPGFDLFFGM